jgi:glycosyltransferase involved in cell wall biosynthesis
MQLSSFSPVAAPEALPPLKSGSIPKIGVLFIIDQLCEIGGAERVLANMIAGLPSERFACSIVTFKAGPKVQLLNLKCPLHVFPLQRTYGWNALKVAWQIRQLIRSVNIQIVHTFFETADLWAGPIARLSGCRTLISSRRDMGILRSWKHRVAYRIAWRLYSQVHAVSGQVRDYCIQHDGIDPRKVITLYNGVCMEKTQSPPAHDLLNEISARGSTALISTVGNIRWVKGLDVFIRAAAIVSRKYPEPVLFAVAGENQDSGHMAELTALIATLGIEDRVIFLGKRDDVRSILNTSDIFCLLSRSEGLSNALLEAMSAARPCVASTVGGNGELIQDGRNGYLVKSEDPAAAAERILALLRDRDLCGRFGREAQHTVETQFTAGRMIDNLVASYERLLNKEQPEIRKARR